MPKVLIVDDEEDILWGLSEELSRNGIDVDTASNGQEAFEKIKENDYDFLITDIRMPGMSGSELLLKSKNLRPDLKVVVMTAYGSDELKQEVLSHGAISYLEKPFDFEQLLELIKEKGKKVDETISKLSLNQFLQLVSMEGQSCTITVKTDEGEGKVYFIDGEVVNAEFQNFTGEEAFIKIMKFQKPAFDVDWGVPQTKRMIEKPLHALLLAAVAKKEEEEAGVSGSEELSEEEVDLSALSELFGEDEGVAEESKEEVVEEEVVEETAPAEQEGEMEISLEGISFEDEGVVEEEVEEKVEEKHEEEEEPAEEEFSIENIESMLEEEVKEEEVVEEEVKEEKKEEVEEPIQEKEELEEEFSLENLESMLEEEVKEEAEEEVVKEEVKQEVAEESAKEETALEEEVSLESLEKDLEELVEEPSEEEKAKEVVEEVEEEATEKQKEEVLEISEESEKEEIESKETAIEEEKEETMPEVEEKVEVEEKIEEEKEEVQEEVEVKEEVSKQPESVIEKKGAPVISEDKRHVPEDVLRKIVALTTDIHAGFIADINGNIISSQFKTGSVKGDELGYLGEYVGMMHEILKQVTGEGIEDITISLKNENLIAAPALEGNIVIFVVTTKRTMKLALIKVELKKAVARLREELS